MIGSAPVTLLPSRSHSSPSPPRVAQELTKATNDWIWYGAVLEALAYIKVTEPPSPTPRTSQVAVAPTPAPATGTATPVSSGQVPLQAAEQGRAHAHSECGLILVDGGRQGQGQGVKASRQVLVECLGWTHWLNVWPQPIPLAWVALQAQLSQLHWQRHSYHSCRLSYHSCTDECILVTVQHLLSALSARFLPIQHTLHAR